ncbi:hypothetical protein Q9233_002973 [Columba guinea]|nr:hypothetical protein Q9233_002973 [Columba guinea]
MIVSYFYNLYLYVNKYYRPFEMKIKVVGKCDPALHSKLWLCIFASNCQCVNDHVVAEIRGPM